jgi:DNA primase
MDSHGFGAESVRIHIVQLEGGLDPDEFCKEHGGEAYSGCVSRAKSYFYWLADRARTRFDMRTAEGRVDAFQFLLPAVQGLTDKIERVAVANDVASYLNVTSGLVLENFRKLAADKRDTTVRPSTIRLAESDRILISVMLLDADARERLIPALKELTVIGQSPAGKIYEALFALAESGEAMQYASLYDRLEEPERAALSATLMGGDQNESSLTMEAALSCLESLRAKERDGKTAELKARIRDAERAGNFQEALALMQLL